MRSKVVVMMAQPELSNAVIFIFMFSFSFKPYLNTIFGCRVMASLVNQGLKSFRINAFSRITVRSYTFL